MYPETPVVKYLQKNAGIYRFWGYGSAYIKSNFQTYDGTFSPEGNDPLHIRNYAELFSASGNGHFEKVLPRVESNIAGGYGTEELASNLYRQKVLNIAGVSYVLNYSEAINGKYNPDYVTFPEKSYKLEWQEGFWQVYKNLSVTPRFYLTNKYVVVKDKNAALAVLFNKKFDEKTTLILYEDPEISSGAFVKSSKMVSYTPNRVEISTISTKPSLLYLSDNLYPGWVATVDGKESKIYLANYTFRAVEVPAGKHNVVFEFKPKSFYYGIYISIFGLVSLLVFNLLVVKTRKDEK
jgi:hypothetical protein